MRGLKYDYDSTGGDYDHTLNCAKYTTNNRLFLAVFFSLLSVVVLESVAVTDLLVAPKRIANFSDELTTSGDLARARLRSALGLARGNADEAHHLIPVGLRDHDVVERAARSGFNFNGAENGAAMTFDRHRGVNIFHHNKYNNAIRSRLDRELLNSPIMTDAQAAAFLRRYTEQLRNAINNTQGRLR